MQAEPNWAFIEYLAKQKKLAHSNTHKERPLLIGVGVMKEVHI